MPITLIALCRPILDVLGEIDRAHPAAQLLQDMVPIGDDPAYRVPAGLDARRVCPSRWQNRISSATRPADGATSRELHFQQLVANEDAGPGPEQRLSPDGDRVPLRLPMSVMTKSASSLRTEAWSELIEGS